MILRLSALRIRGGATAGRPFLRSAVLVAAAALASCSPEPATERDAAPPTTTAPFEAPAWSAAFRASGAGAALTLSDDSGPVLRLACTRGPATLVAYAERLSPIGSEERFSLGLDDDPVVLVADLSGRVERGVEASAPLTPELIGRLRAARTVGASYGAQTLGPAPLDVDPEARRRFVDACREIAGLDR